MIFTTGDAVAPPRKLSRVEKNENTRLRLIEAAIEVVGRVGYRDASINEITSRARVAQGTFYTHFESRQALLEQLLPQLGSDLLAYVRERVAGNTALEREAKSLRAYFDFIRERPAFHRILVEAQIYAPESFTRHVDHLMRSYVASLAKSKANGYLLGYEEGEFSTIATLLMGARVQLSAAYGYRDGQPERVPDDVVRTFIRFMAGGLNALPPTPPNEDTGAGLALKHSTSNDVWVRFGPEEVAESPSARQPRLRRWSGELIQRALDGLHNPDLGIESEQLQQLHTEICSSVAGSASVEVVTPTRGIISWKLFDELRPESVLAFGVSFYGAARRPLKKTRARQRAGTQNKSTPSPAHEPDLDSPRR